jgi:hypothetical protein
MHLPQGFLIDEVEIYVLSRLAGGLPRANHHTCTSILFVSLLACLFTKVTFILPTFLTRLSKGFLRPLRVLGNNEFAQLTRVVSTLSS